MHGPASNNFTVVNHAQEHQTGYCFYIRFDVGLPEIPDRSLPNMAADNVVHLLQSLQRETNCERALKTSCKIARTIILEVSYKFTNTHYNQFDHCWISQCSMAVEMCVKLWPRLLL